MSVEGTKRVIIENVRPEIDCGRFPIKRVAGERVVVMADIYTDGHDSVAGRLLHRKTGSQGWVEVPLVHEGNDRWRGEFIVEDLGSHEYTLTAWVDHFQTWRQALEKKVAAGQDVGVELRVGSGWVREAALRSKEGERDRLMVLAGLLAAGEDPPVALSAAMGDDLRQLMSRHPNLESATRYERVLHVTVDSPKALFSTWYERFPRSASPDPGRHGTLSDLEGILPEIARMGFDVLYLPPIHPIGTTHRKGKDNAPLAQPDDPGSPWAIGSEEGGHKSIDPRLGSFDDFERLRTKALEHGVEIALDLAFQCSPDHPYVREHPEWFRRRPDGTIQYAENPPKKYQDIYPLNFETDHWRSLWEELESVILFWIDRGVRIFRVDNPHTKSFPFWEWVIARVRREFPQVVFLAEAFTRPKVMYRLAKLGFSQSYTYFTWRHTKRELTDYLVELTKDEPREYFRPNFWPNTPDILPEFLQYGGRSAFVIRLILAATLSSNYGIYGPAFELLVSESLPGREEYLHSEKYEIRHWDWNQQGNLKELIARVNRIRRENPVFQSTWNLKFYEVDNDSLLFFGKGVEGALESVLVVVNLDPFHPQAGWLHVPIKAFGLAPDQPYLSHDLLSDDKYIWHGERNHIQLDPNVLPAHIFKVRKRLRREMDFDYFL